MIQGGPLTRCIGFIILLTLLTVISTFCEAQPNLPICPIGTNGAPNLRDPGIASGAQCRGACGEDCPIDRCDQVADITIPVSDSAGKEYTCIYKDVLNCLTHQGCRDHDACYDGCAASGENSLFGPCHQKCNNECFEKWGNAQCGAWSDITGYRGDYYLNPDFDGVLLFSNPPELVGPVGKVPGSSNTSTSQDQNINATDGSSVGGSQDLTVHNGKEAWVLKEVRPDIKPQPDRADGSYFNYHTSYSGNSVTGGYSWKDSSCRGDVKGELVWTDIPKILIPGDNQETTLTADASGTQSCGYRNIGSGGWLKINGGNYGQDARYPYATSDPKPSPASVKVNWVAPEGKAGDTLTITIVANPPAVQASHNSVNYIYTYQVGGKVEAVTQPPQKSSTPIEGL